MPQAVRSEKVKALHREASVAVARKSMNTGTAAARALVPADKPLTEKMKAFLKLYAEGESVATAMHRAGYQDQPSYGYRILKMPNAQAFLAKAQAAYAEASAMTKKKVIDMHLEAYDMAKLMAEPASMVSAAREIGKLCGFYEPKKVEINLNGGSAQKKLETMSSEELEQLIAEAQQLADAEVPLLERVDGDE